mgnify:CR=1 FL=1
MKAGSVEPMDSTRPFQLVIGVVREALRASKRPMAVVAGGGPEEILLVRWLERAQIPYETPLPEFVGMAEDLIWAVRKAGEERTPEGEAGTLRGDVSPPLGGGGSPGASALAGAALARACGGLLLGAENKTCLLLSPMDGGETCLPLGDLYASDILDLVGAATLPGILVDQSPDTIRAVDKALEAYYGEGLGEEVAFRHLKEEVRESVLTTLSATRWRWQSRPLIPLSLIHI